VYGMALLVVTFSENLPEIKEQFEQNVSYFQQSLGNLIGVSEDRQDEMLNGIGSVGEYLAGFFTATTNTAVAIALLPVYTFLLLLYRNKFQQFLLDVVAPERRETIERILNQAASVVPSYLKGLLVVVLILIVVNSLGFYLIGIEYALLLGIIAALFNLIPYLGTIVGFGAVLLIVLATQTPSLSLGVLLMFFPVQFFENNILTPNITGSYVRINPLVIILSLIGAGMIWGLAGMFLVIPYLAMFKIFCENVDSLKPVGFLLGTRGTEKFMLSMGSFTRFFSKK
ncbi:MAG: AI-2E family transporter, partial [Balneolaceae bacterium]